VTGRYTAGNVAISRHAPAERPRAGGPRFRRIHATVQLRVVTDQPWDVKADVLVIPIVGDPVFDGPLGELDRRTDGSLTALAAFHELSAKRYSTALLAGGSLPAGWVMPIGAGDPATLDREAVARIGAAAERRLGGRAARTLAIWLSRARRRGRRHG
jgi:hypothetical protein